MPPSKKSPVSYTVLGGAGAMGQITVKDLAETASPNSRIVIADANLVKAQALADACQRPGGPRLEARGVDMRQPEQAEAVLKGSTVLLNSLPYALNLEVMALALRLGAHYTDLGGLFHMTRQQRALDAQFQERGLTAVLGMGAAPGITNLLAKLAADELEQVEEIHVRLAAVDRTRYRSVPALPVSYSFKTILEEFSLPPAVFRKGRYRFLKPMSDMYPYRFPAPVGEQRPMHTLHSEILMAESFQSQGVREVSFKIAFDPVFVERVRFLRDLGLASHETLEVQGVQVAPIDLVNQVVMSQPPAVARGETRQYEILRTVVKGIGQGQKQTLIQDCHTSGMPEWGIGTDIDTGTPPAIVAQMLARGEISRRGACYPEEAVPTAPFFAELERRQMFVKRQRKRGWNVPV
ncbi:MAG: saccharopine dehydrogenase family protein [Candidatus Sericytochromatia bacterium]